LTEWKVTSRKGGNPQKGGEIKVTGGGKKSMGGKIVPNLSNLRWDFDLGEKVNKNAGDQLCEGKGNESTTNSSFKKESQRGVYLIEGTIKKKRDYRKGKGTFHTGTAHPGKNGGSAGVGPPRKRPQGASHPKRGDQRGREITLFTDRQNRGKKQQPNQNAHKGNDSARNSQGSLENFSRGEFASRGKMSGK